MTTFVNNNVQSGNVIYASDHNEQGARVAAVLNGGIDSANLADGAVTSGKILDSAVTTAKIADGAVTSVKLAEAYARGRLQAITTNTAPTGLTIQEGWNYVTGTGTGTVTKAITFPVAFATGGLKSFKIGILSARIGSDPTVLEDFNSAINSDIVQASFSGLSVTGFTVNVAAEVTRTLTSGVRYGFWWEAKGIV